MTQKNQPTGIRNIVIIGLAILLGLVWMIAADRVNAAPVAVTVNGTTPCNNGVTERAVAGTMTTTCGSGWSVGSLATNPAFNAVVLGDFEYATIPEINDFGTTPENTLLWNQYEADFTEGPDPGTEQTSTSWALFGTRSLNINVTGGNIYGQLFPFNNYSWLWMRDQIERGTWKHDTFNRLKFYLKVPSGEISQTLTGQKNFTFGTYIRAEGGAANNAEDGGGHFYHNYDLKSLDATAYWQVEADFHVNHERTYNGSVEHGSKEYVTGDAGRNYFDQMTRFYFEFDGTLSGYPRDFYVDGFHLYKAPEADDIDQIYSVAGAFVPSTNEIVMTWARRKDQGTQTFDIKYSFTNIYTLGYENAAAAPSGSGISPVDSGAYQTMYYSTTGIDVTGQDKIYIAIKAVGSSIFRQFELALTSAGLPDLGSVQ